MDNTQVKNDGQVQSPVQNNIPTQPVDNAQGKKTQQPVSGVAKEMSPLPPLSSSEWVAPSTPEVHIPNELKEHMEATPIPTVSQDAGAAGVRLTKEATPVTIAADEPLGMNTPPSVLEKIKKAHSSMKNSIRWLAEVIGLAQKKRDHEIAHPSDSNSIQHKAYEKGGKE